MATTLTALAEYGGDQVRRSLDLERAYLQGRFGAVPELAEHHPPGSSEGLGGHFQVLPRAVLSEASIQLGAGAAFAFHRRRPADEAQRPSSPRAFPALSFVPARPCLKTVSVSHSARPPGQPEFSRLGLPQDPARIAPCSHLHGLPQSRSGTRDVLQHLRCAPVAAPAPFQAKVRAAT